MTVIRCSALTYYTDCERRGAIRLFWSDITAAGYKLRATPRGIGALIGTAVHRGAEVALKEKATSGELPPVTVPQDAAMDCLFEQWQSGEEILYDGGSGATHSRLQAERQTVQMVSSYHRVVAPEIHPIITEERLEATIAPGLMLSGQPDVVAREPRTIRDLKTGTRPPSTFAPQLGGYSLLARSNGLDIDHARIDFVQRVRVTTPQPDPIARSAEIAAAETAARSIIRHIVDDLRTFRDGDAERGIAPGDPWSFTANPSSILCSAKYCPAYGQRGPHAWCNEWTEK